MYVWRVRREIKEAQERKGLDSLKEM